MLTGELAPRPEIAHENTVADPTEAVLGPEIVPRVKGLSTSSTWGAEEKVELLPDSSAK